MSGVTTTERVLMIEEIMKYLPHRYPMLMVDRVFLIDDSHCIAIKNVSINEEFFSGHYPERPIMPGVLIIEAMAQAGATILLATPTYAGLVPVIGAIDEVKFRRQVVPGDQLRTEVELLWIKQGVGKIRCQATVDGELAARMELTFKLIGKEK